MGHYMTKEGVAIVCKNCLKSELRRVSMLEKLTELWMRCGTKQLSKIFKEYMEDLEVRQWNSRRKDNRNTYLIDGDSTGWNRVECYYYKDSERYLEEDLRIVLRKESGDYLIIAKEEKRAFEVDYSGIRNLDRELLSEIVEEHRPLFNKLFGLVS